LYGGGTQKLTVKLVRYRCKRGHVLREPYVPASSNVKGWERLGSAKKLHHSASYLMRGIYIHTRREGTAVKQNTFCGL